METAKVVVGQFLKDLDKAPGWFPLLVTVLMWLYWVRFPEAVQFRGRTVLLSAELVASVVTFILYRTGDALDELVFKKRERGKTKTRALYKNAYRDKSTSAQKRLGVGENGLYALSNQLLAAADKKRKKHFVYLFNEAAKFLRSLFAPFLIFGLVLLVRGRLGLGGFLFGTSILVLIVYPWLKVAHIRRLYSEAENVAGKGEFEYKDAGGVRLYFWEGKFMAAGMRSTQTAPAERNTRPKRWVHIQPKPKRFRNGYVFTQLHRGRRSNGPVNFQRPGKRKSKTSIEFREVQL